MVEKGGEKIPAHNFHLIMIITNRWLLAGGSGGGVSLALLVLHAVLLFVSRAFFKGVTSLGPLYLVENLHCNMQIAMLGNHNH